MEPMRALGVATLSLIEPEGVHYVKLRVRDAYPAGEAPLACFEADVVEVLEVFYLRDKAHGVLAAADAGFDYRHTDLRADTVVIGAHLSLHPGDPVGIRRAMDDARRWRRETQPIAEPNCGSVFTNPPGAHAAALIDAAGLKGERVGGACVSRKHANFIVTEPGATAADVEALIAVIQQRVEATAGIRLTPEVRVIGGERG